MISILNLKDIHCYLVKHLFYLNLEESIPL